MKSPKDMKVIQIDITNACVLACSNCTRMCGHHEKTFMMDFDTFKRAVDSLENFPGTIGVIGGEPTLHPEFERFALYLQSKYPHLYGEEIDNHLMHPVTDFMKNIQDLGLKYTKNNRLSGEDNAVVPTPGLFSVAGTGYLKHFEVIQDTFKRQGLNNHGSEMYHQPAMVARKDLGISDEDWIPMRDNCWLQNNWSAGITPKGAFFCEIAGTLDMLFDGPGGWLLEKDWWKREPEEFGDQLQWCELCGFACETYTRNAKDKIDDVSPSLYEKLKTINSPKLKAGHVNVMEITNGVISEQSKAVDFTYRSSDLSTGAPYIKYISEKFSLNDSVLHPEGFVSLYHISKNTSMEQMKSKIEFAKEHYHSLYAFCENSAVWETWQSVLAEKSELTVTSYHLEEVSYGSVINKILKKADHKKYFVATTGDYEITKEFIEKFKESTPNPGTMFYCDGTLVSDTQNPWITFGSEQSGFIGVFNSSALSLREIGFDGIAHCEKFPDLVKRWTKKKCIPFDGQLFVNTSKEQIREGDRCVIFGAGGRLEDIFYLIGQRNAKCVAVVDSNPKKQGLPYENLIIENPQFLKGIVAEVDRVLLGAPIYFDEIREILIKMGYQKEIINLI